MTGSSACGSGLKFVKQTQPNPRLAQRAGHYIMTNPKIGQSLGLTMIEEGFVRPYQSVVLSRLDYTRLGDTLKRAVTKVEQKMRSIVRDCVLHHDPVARPNS